MNFLTLSSLFVAYSLVISSLQASQSFVVNFRCSFCVGTGGPGSGDMAYNVDSSAVCETVLFEGIEAAERVAESATLSQ